MSTSRTALAMAALGVVVTASVTGCSTNDASPSPAKSPSSARTATPKDRSPSGGLRQERDQVDADLDAAAAEAQLTGLSPDPDPNATSPTERKLNDCSALWSGSTGRALGEGRGDEPFAAAVRALEKRGWKLASRQQDGALTRTALAKGEWTVKGKLSESDRIDLITFVGYHSSCAKDIAALPGPGPKA
ncbi:hypothetical protein ACFH04_02595 [Streptomyces noboritoensis]|uniref:Lipoprotein n=1 Tax=Streptomyces noboritoensis TaxID=67337 RepID=A0ABV6TDT2_9ACTN